MGERQLTVLGPKAVALTSAVMLIAIGTVLLVNRYTRRQEAKLNPGDTTWELSYDLTFTALRKHARLYVAPAEDTAHCRVFRQVMTHPGMITEAHRTRVGRQPGIQAVTLRPGDTSFRASFLLHLSTNSPWPVPKEPKPGAEQRAYYLRSTHNVQIQDDAVRQTYGQIRPKKTSKDDYLNLVFQHCHRQLGLAIEDAKYDAVSVLLEREGSALGISRAMIALLRCGGLPARLVSGVVIEDTEVLHPHHWVEVWRNNSWIPFDPTLGHSRNLPSNYLPVVRESSTFVSGDNQIRNLTRRYRLEQITPPRGLISSQLHWTDILQFKRLPLSTQEILAILLLLPFGALVNAFFRTVIGLQTFGVFTPALLALSFLYADRLSGVIMIVSILVVAFVGRALLDRLRMLMLPRLGIILTLIVLLSAFALSFFDFVQLTPGSKVVLLPIVILTMLTERFFVTTEEDGMLHALKLLLQTGLAAGVSLLILLWKDLAELVLVYPEVHCFTCAAFIGLGRYTGYRLTELWRFRDLVRDDDGGGQ